jgi:hypothetical protein
MLWPVIPLIESPPGEVISLFVVRRLAGPYRVRSARVQGLAGPSSVRGVGSIYGYQQSINEENGAFEWIKCKTFNTMK